MPEVTFIGTTANLASDVLTNVAPSDLLDIIDLKGADAAATLEHSKAGWVLQVHDATHSGAVTLSGDLDGLSPHVSPDSHGGTLIRFA